MRNKDDIVITIVTIITIVQYLRRRFEKPQAFDLILFFPKPYNKDKYISNKSLNKTQRTDSKTERSTLG